MKIITKLLKDARSRRFWGQRGMTMPMVIVLMLVIIPVGLVMYNSVNMSSRSAAKTLKKRTAMNYASDAILDYMRQFTNFTVGDYFDPKELERALMSRASGAVEFDYEPNEEQKTILLIGRGKFGIDPDNPEAEQVIEALIYFHPGVMAVGTDIRSTGRYRMEQNDALYRGSFLFQDATIAGDNVTFEIGPVYVEGNLSVNASSLPTFKCDLYVGGNLNATPNMVGGNLYRYVPELPAPDIDIEAYREPGIAFDHRTAPTTFIFNGDGTYTWTDSFNKQIGGANAKFENKLMVINKSLPSAIPNDAVFLVDGANVGIYGTIKPRVTVVAYGQPKVTGEGNAYLLDNIYYVGGSSVSTNESSLAVLASNQISIYAVKPGNLSVRGALYSINSPHIPVTGDSNASFYFSGTRNGRFIMNGNSFNNGVTQDYDSGLTKFTPPNLPSRAILVNLTFKAA